MDPTASPPARLASWPALVFGLAFPTVLTAVYFVALAGQPRGLVQGVYAAGKALQFGFPAAVVLVSTGRLPRPRGPRRGGAGALLGAAFGVALFAAALALYLCVLRGVFLPGGALAGAPAAAVRAKVAALGVGDPLAFAALGAFYSTVHAAAEEYYWRWFVFGGLRTALGAAPAIAVSSLGFAAHHAVLLAVFFGGRSPWTWGLALAVGAGGAFWAWLYHRSGSLLGPWLGHLLADAAIFVVGFDLVR
jgi:membrane protease YdiL (CAAX protease family)